MYRPGSHRSAPRLLLAGGTGFIGSHVAKRFDSAGWSVAHLGRTHRVEQTVSEAAPDVVVDLIRDLEADTIGRPSPTSLALAKAALSAGIPMIMTGSYTQFDSTWARVDRSPTAQARSRLMGRVARWSAEFGVPFAIAVPFSVYGPSDRRHKLVPLLIRAATRGLAIDMACAQDPLDLVHVRDIAQGYLALADVVRAGSIDIQRDGLPLLPLATGVPITLGELVDLVEQACSCAVRARWDIVPSRPWAANLPYREIAPIARWAPTISAVAGIREMAVKSGYDGF